MADRGLEAQVMLYTQQLLCWLVLLALSPLLLSLVSTKGFLKFNIFFTCRILFKYGFYLWKTYKIFLSDFVCLTWWSLICLVFCFSSLWSTVLLCSYTTYFSHSYADRHSGWSSWGEQSSKPHWTAPSVVSRHIIFEYPLGRFTWITVFCCWFSGGPPYWFSTRVWAS